MQVRATLTGGGLSTLVRGVGLLFRVARLEFFLRASFAHHFGIAYIAQRFVP